jgi:diadenosine tetraphosphatase ApaH/serine/threonine PP2A family protein phosphatase
MKVAVISDVHSNLAALEAVLEEARRRSAGEVWSLGDAVGYGPRPLECLELLAREASLQIMGNHDAAAVELTSVAYFNEHARKAVEWTRGALGETQLEAIRKLPYTARSGNCLLVHGSPDDPPAWHYITSPSRARPQFDSFDEQLCLVGHSHVPFIAVDTGPPEENEGLEAKVYLEEGRRYFVNAGSVGQPRDRDPRASWVLLDRDERSIRMLRTPYDVAKTQALMREEGLPAFLIDRLSLGV